MSRIHRYQSYRIPLRLRRPKDCLTDEQLRKLRTEEIPAAADQNHEQAVERREKEQHV